MQPRAPAIAGLVFVDAHLFIATRRALPVHRSADAAVTTAHWVRAWIETIDDVPGLAAARHVYRLSLAGREPPVLDGYAAEQRFLLGWAQDCRATIRDATRRRPIVTDPHVPTPDRALTVRNLTAWYAAFGVVAGPKLYLSPSERVTVW